MTLFDSLFFSVFNRYKARYKKKTNTISVIYITTLQAAILLTLGVFVAEFLNQMHVDTMTSTKAWLLFVISIVILYFKNWMQYTGRNRQVLNAKLTKHKLATHSLMFIIAFPLGCLFLAALLLKVL